MAVKDQSGGWLTGLYIENGRGEIQALPRPAEECAAWGALGIAGASGSGFVVSADGFITYQPPRSGQLEYVIGFPVSHLGILIRNINGRMQTDPNWVMRRMLGSYVPANAAMVGEDARAAEGSVKGKEYVYERHLRQYSFAQAGAISHAFRSA